MQFVLCARNVRLAVLFRTALVVAFSITLLLANFGPASTAAADDWPAYLNGNARCGATAEQLQLPLRAEWVYTSPAPPETAWDGPRSESFEGLDLRPRVDFDNVLHVTVGDQLAFVGSSVDNKVLCIDTATSKIRWQFITGGPVRLVPTYAEGRIYFGADDGYVYCLLADSGELVWKLRAGPSDERLLARGRMISRWPIRTGVVIDGDVAYFGAGVLPHEGVYLYAVRTEDGSIVWRNDTISAENAGRNPLSPQGYLLCSKDQLIVPSGRSLPAAFDKATGRELYQSNQSWRSTAGGPIGGTKAVLADGQIYTAGSHHFLALNQKSGAVGFAWIDGRQLVISDRYAFVADGTRVTAVDRLEHAKATIERQKLRLQLRDVQSKRRNMAPADYRSKLSALNKKIAELSQIGVLWAVDCKLDASLIAAGSVVIAGGDGEVVALDVASGKTLWQQQVEGEVGGLAVANGRLFASTTAGKIYCFAASETVAEGTRPRQLPNAAQANPYPHDALTAVYAATAETILKTSGVTRGYCLVVGSQRGRLAYELARRSKLRIYGVESDPVLARESRALLDRAALHGTRITILDGDPAKLPVSDFFANVIVSDQVLLTGQLPAVPSEIVRCVKPCGGQVCLVVPKDAPAHGKSDVMQRLRATIDELNLAIGGTVQQTRDTLVVTRGALPGAGQWSHQYGNPANTMMSEDQRVRGDLGVLWYGDPGPSKMINRHDAAAAPLSTGGRLFVQGFETIMAYDAYNGLFLWEFKNPGAVRTGVFNNEDTSNFVASEDFVFSVVDDTCTLIDAATGKKAGAFKVPKSSDGQPRIWGYVAEYQGTLFGTSTLRQDLERSRRRRGLQIGKTTDALFAIDLQTGKRRWVYRGGSIEHVTIAIGDDRIFLIDSSITRDERDALLRQDKAALQSLSPEEAAKKEAELKGLDVRLAICLDAQTGDKIWARPVDVTDCSRVGIGGGNLMLMYHNGHVVICGANANGHYWRQFLSGQFSRRRLVVLDAETGEKLWAKDANYRHRPIIVGEEVFAEPWAFDLHTGKEKMREHPVTGKQTVWQFSRPGHHCGPVTAAPNMLFFRSGFTGYYDLYEDSGTTHFAGQRLGCWVNAIPGNGLLMVPEASAGCVCQFSLAATIVMQPRTDRKSWRIYSASGPSTPVKHLALNLGAPGDRRDAQGTLWIAYPRPRTVRRLEYVLSIPLKYLPGGGIYQKSEESVTIENAEAPWVLTSGMRGLQRLEIPLLSKDDKPARYGVRCHFAALEPTGSKPATFDIKLQGKLVAENVDVQRAAGGVQRAWIATFDNIEVTDKLLLELVPKSSVLPTISGVEVRRE